MERIRNGIQSGQLTQEEADKLIAQQDKIHQMIKDALLDGISQIEAKRILAVQDKASDAIKKNKHDGEINPAANAAAGAALLNQGTALMANPPAVPPGAQLVPIGGPATPWPTQNGGMQSGAAGDVNTGTGMPNAPTANTTAPAPNQGGAVGAAR